MGGRADVRNVGATRKGTGNYPFTASGARGRLLDLRGTVARCLACVQRTDRDGAPAARRRPGFRRSYRVVVVVPAVVVVVLVLVVVPPL
jgi:hypothetical protein